MVQQNNGFNFTGGGNSFWTAGDFMTRHLTPVNFINFQAVGEYWFDDDHGQLDRVAGCPICYLSCFGRRRHRFCRWHHDQRRFCCGWCDRPQCLLRPNQCEPPCGATNASKAIYISQGTLGQPGNTNSTVYNPLPDPNANPPDSPPNYAPPYNSEYTQTNFTGGPYHINAFGDANAWASVWVTALSCWDISRLSGMAPPPWTPNIIRSRVETLGITIWTPTRLTSLGTAAIHLILAARMTSMLLFQNGQFPFYMFGFRASTNFSEVVGLDPGRIPSVTFDQYLCRISHQYDQSWRSKPVPFSFVSPPGGYGTLNYQWYQNGVADQRGHSINISTSPALPSPIRTCRRARTPACTRAWRRIPAAPGAGHQLGCHRSHTIGPAGLGRCADAP